MNLPVHEAVLEAANTIAHAGDGTFTPDEVVRALPHLNENTVRTHIVSRCCVGAPKHHATVWPYFRRYGRGRYRIEPKYRTRSTASAASGKDPNVAAAIGEQVRTRQLRRDTIHVVVHKGESAYVAECLEVAVVTQGKTLDEVVDNVRQALVLHLEDEDLDALGLTDNPRVQMIYDMALAS